MDLLLTLFTYISLAKVCDKNDAQAWRRWLTGSECGVEIARVIRRFRQTAFPVIEYRTPLTFPRSYLANEMTDP
jgi:hypothetical protein